MYYRRGNRASYFFVSPTSMLFMLEQTPSEQWIDWENNQTYFEVMICLYGRLSESLSKCYLPSYFVDEINLLVGYSKSFLKGMALKINLLFHRWTRSTETTSFLSDVEEVPKNFSLAETTLSNGNQATGAKAHGNKSWFKRSIETVNGEGMRYLGRKKKSYGAEVTQESEPIYERNIFEKYDLETGKIRKTAQRSRGQSETPPRSPRQTENKFGQEMWVELTALIELPHSIKPPNPIKFPEPLSLPDPIEFPEPLNLPDLRDTISLPDHFGFPEDFSTSFERNIYSELIDEYSLVKTTWAMEELCFSSCYSMKES